MNFEAICTESEYQLYYSLLRNWYMVYIFSVPRLSPLDSKDIS